MTGKQSVKAVTYLTGKGELTGFVAVMSPSVMYNPEGVYSASILLDKEEGESLETLLKQIRFDQFSAYGKGSKMTDLPCQPYSIADPETGEETPDEEGRYILRTSAKARIREDKLGFKPVVLDSRKNIITEEIPIGKGSIVRLALSLEGYTVGGKTGVSARLKAVQVIKLVGYTVDVNSYGFEEEEGYITSTEAGGAENCIIDEDEIPF